jgi:hypothetical protein
VERVQPTALRETRVAASISRALSGLSLPPLPLLLVFARASMLLFVEREKPLGSVHARAVVTV